MADEKVVEKVENESEPKSEPKNASEGGSSSGHVKRLNSAHTSGMEASILKFKDVNFTVGSKNKTKNILSDVSGVVRFGRVLASKY